MLRRLPAVVVALWALAVPAATHAADGAYALNDEGGLLLTFLGSDRGVTEATMRFALGCPSGLPYWWTDRMTIARRSPRRSVRDQTFLVRRPSRAGTLRYRLIARTGGRKRFDAIEGTLTLSSLGSRSARVRLELRSRSRSPGSRCSLDLDARARRAAGQIFAGHTDDDEPVMLIRYGDLVVWRSGYGWDCRPSGFMEGLHADALLMTGPDTFGWPRPIAGYGDDAFDQEVQISGAFAGDGAEGTLRIIGTAENPRQRCDTRVRRWEATSR
jgi:hypothetical protein